MNTPTPPIPQFGNGSQYPKRADFGPETTFHDEELAIGVARGVRAFTLTSEGWLIGITYPYPWKPGENVARCLTGSQRLTETSSETTRRAWLEEPDHSPGKCPRGNGHGFYAYYDGSTTYRAPSRPEAVIEGYGKVVLGSRGFRAERAEIVALTVPSIRIKERAAYEAMAWRYQGIALFDNFEAMVSEFPPDRGTVVNG